MSDDLVKQLRDLGDHAAFEPHMHHTAADRIEKLEREVVRWHGLFDEKHTLLLAEKADLRKMALDYLAAQGQAAEAYQAQLEAEAKLSRAVEGLQHYACDCVISCEQLNGSCGDMARTTLAELKGETDE